MLDKNTIAQDFPILDQFVHDEPLVYLDNAATTQKPKSVLEAVNHYYLQIMPMSTVEFIPWLNERQQLMRRRVKSRKLSMLHQPRKCSLQEDNDGLNWVARYAEEVLKKGRSPDFHHGTSLQHHPLAASLQETGAKLVYVYLKDGLLDMQDLKRQA